MLRVLLWLLLFSTTLVQAEIDPPAVTQAQLDAAVEQVNATFAQDDPQRDALLKVYSQTGEALVAYQQSIESQQAFSLARENASNEAKALQQELSRLRVAPAEDVASFAGTGLAELEQMIKVDKSELKARKAERQDTRADIDGMPARSAAVRERLTELVGALSKLRSDLGLMNQAPEVASEDEARLWRMQAELASTAAEKAALDDELLSQPMRVELLKARLDTASFNVSVLEKRLRILEERAAELRKDQAETAQAEAELVRAGVADKHPLVQEMAEINAELSASFSLRGEAIEKVRQRDSAHKKEAEQAETDLKTIERKLQVLGMTTIIGEILREQSVQLPTRRDAHKLVATVGEDLQQSSMRHIELEDERRQLRDPRKFVERHLGTLGPQLHQEVRDDLRELARNRKDLVKQAIRLENTYAAALGDLEFTLHRYDVAIEQYRDFISERLLWIPSRETFSLFRDGGLPAQLAEVFAAERWMEVFRILPAELAQRPRIILAFLVVLLLVSLSRRLFTWLQEAGRTVGYPRTDIYMNTIRALGISILFALKWPLLVLAVSWLFQAETDNQLALALSDALARISLYFWGLEFMRVILLPGGLAAAHFRWPSARVERLTACVVRLQWLFLPATFLVIFSIDLYPREVGGQLGALGVCLVLLAIANFFHRLPRFVQGKLDLIFIDRPQERAALWGKVSRWLLTWVPVLGIVAVLLGYSYTAIELALLLVKTVVLYSAVLLAQELGLRWLRLTRRRMLIRAREEAAQAAAEEGEDKPEEEFLENDPELLSDAGSKLLNALVIIATVVGIAIIWAEVFPALGILDSVELWHQSGIVDGLEATVPVTLRDVFAAVVIAMFGWVVVRRVPRLLEILLRQRVHIRPASAYAVGRVFQYTLTTVLVVAVMGSLGGSWSQIQWAVAALSVGIGFGLQEIVANFISGLIILFEQPIRVGDTVTVGNVSGTVTKIRMRATTVRDWDRRELLVPNKEFITSQLLNWSLSDPITRCVIEVGVAYGTDVARAMRIIRLEAEKHPLVLSDPAPFITFDEFGDNSLGITVRVYLEDLDKRLSTSSDLRVAINDRFNEEGIVVAFPQRDVHLDSAEPLAVRVVPPVAGDDGVS